LTHDELTLYASKCWATYHREPNSRPMRELINSCDTTETVRRGATNSPLEQRFSFDAFRFNVQGQNNNKKTCEVFVHCDLLICKTGDANSRCNECNYRRRGKRSALSSQSTDGSFISKESLTVGPFIISETRPGYPASADGLDRMNRLDAVGQRLSEMMQQMRNKRT